MNLGKPTYFLYNCVLSRVGSAWISRAMVLSNHSLNADELKQYVSDNLSYCIFPPGSDAGNTDTPIYGIYQNDETMACPKGECKY